MKTDNNALYMIIYFIVTLLVAWVAFSLIITWFNPNFQDTTTGGVNWWTTLWVSALIIIFSWLFMLIIYFIISLFNKKCCPQPQPQPQVCGPPPCPQPQPQPCPPACPQPQPCPPPPCPQPQPCPPPCPKPQQCPPPCPRPQQYSPPSPCPQPCSYPCNKPYMHQCNMRPNTNRY